MYCMIGIAHLQNGLILSHSSHFNNVTDHNVSKCIMVSVARTSSNTHLEGLVAIHTLIGCQLVKGCIFNLS